MLLQLLIPRFSIRLFPLCLSCVRPRARSVSGGGAERLPAPQLPVYIVLGALVSLPRADLRLQMSLGFSPWVSWLGLGRGEPARAVRAVESFRVTKCVAGGFFVKEFILYRGIQKSYFFYAVLNKNKKNTRCDGHIPFLRGGMKDAASVSGTSDNTVATMGTAGLSPAETNSKAPTPRFAERC